MLDRSTLISFFKKYSDIKEKNNLDVINIIKKIDPNDDYSIAMWSLDQDIFKNKLSQFTKKNDKVLDFGCGSGNWTCAAAREVQSVKAVDISEGRINSLREILLENKIENVEADLITTDNYELGKEIYNIVICYNVLPYMPDYEKQIQKFHSALKPGGLLFLSFSEIGILYFYLWSAVRMRSLTIFIKICLTFLKSKMMISDKYSGSKIRYNGVYLPSRAILKISNDLGFEARNDLLTQKEDIYPKMIWKVPCFKELVLQKTRK